MKFEFQIKRAPTSENPLQTVARRTGMAAEQKGRKREIATGAVKSIEGIIMVRGKVKEKDKGPVHSARGCCTASCCERCHPVVGARMPSRSGREQI